MRVNASFFSRRGPQKNPAGACGVARGQEGQAVTEYLVVTALIALAAVLAPALWQEPMQAYFSRLPEAFARTR